MNDPISVYESPYEKCGYLCIPAAHYGQAVRKLVKNSRTRSKADQLSTYYVTFKYRTLDEALHVAIQMALVTGLEIKIEE